MNMKTILCYLKKVRKSNSKDFKQLTKELDSMLENKVIDGNDYSYLQGYLLGVIDTKIDYNIEEK
ncbi:MAG: hypothetical protein SOX53_03735 [Candidatus Onthovivens sp.]|nr:hypothetical protein [Candidatus Onthovivens sp.]